MYEGIPKVLQAQWDDIDIIKCDIIEIKSHVIAHTIWRKEIGERLSNIVNIHSMFMGHLSNPSDDAKKGEEGRR